MVGPQFEVTPHGPEGEAPVAAAASRWRIGGLGLSTMRVSPQTFRRSTRHLRRDGMDNYAVMLFHSGQWRGEFGGEARESTGGDIRLIDFAAPSAAPPGTCAPMPWRRRFRHRPGWWSTTGPGCAIMAADRIAAARMG